MSETKSLEEQNQQLVKDFFRLINYMGNDKDLMAEFAKVLKTEHRQLQAYTITLLYDLIRDYASIPNDRTDARNVWPVKWARAVKDLEVTLDISELQGFYRRSNA